MNAINCEREKRTYLFNICVRTPIIMIIITTPAYYKRIYLFVVVERADGSGGGSALHFSASDEKVSIVR